MLNKRNIWKIFIVEFIILNSHAITPEQQRHIGNLDISGMHILF